MYQVTCTEEDYAEQAPDSYVAARLAYDEARRQRHNTGDVDEDEILEWKKTLRTMRGAVYHAQDGKRFLGDAHWDLPNGNRIEVKSSHSKDDE